MMKTLRLVLAKVRVIRKKLKDELELGSIHVDGNTLHGDVHHIGHLVLQKLNLPRQDMKQLLAFFGGGEHTVEAGAVLSEQWVRCTAGALAEHGPIRFGCEHYRCRDSASPPFAQPYCQQA